MKESPSLTLSDIIAVWAGKLSAKAIRTLGLGLASNLPGKVSRQFSAKALSKISKQSKFGVIAISGTNGKSTSSGLLASILRVAGHKVVHNRQGANLVTGITACVIDACNWNGKIDTDYFLFEVDEAALPVISKEIEISHITVTNLFRDQLDRFGELDTTARLISKGILENNAIAILNADDPNVAQMVPDSQRLFYGLELNETNSLGSNLNSELSYCAKCGQEYAYTSRFYGQLGHYHCDSCGNKRPKPDIIVDKLSIQTNGSRFCLKFGQTDLQISLKLPGLFNVYNALSAAAMAFALGIAPEAIREGLSSYSTLFGRSERVKIHEKELLIQLIKNPSGASQAVKAAAADSTGKYLIAINDNYADGRDISWLWDAEFEEFATSNGEFVVSGTRCQDMAIRLKYAGVEPSSIIVESSIDKALDKALELCKPGELLWLLPTYTSLLELEKIMKAKGAPLSAT